MTTKRIYNCNVCRDEIDTLTGVGFSFTSSGDRKVECGLPAQHETHLCYKCMAAIYNLSVRLYPYGENEGKETT